MARMAGLFGLNGEDIYVTQRAGSFDSDPHAASLLRYLTNPLLFPTAESRRLELLKRYRQGQVPRRFADFLLTQAPGKGPSLVQIVHGISGGIQVLDGAQLGIAFGSVLGRRVTSDPFEQILASGSLSTVLGAVGEFVDVQLLGGTPSTALLAHGLSGVTNNLLLNIEGAGIGALSSYLTAELFSSLGVSGIAGDVANSVGGAVVSQIITNVAHLGESYQVVENGVAVTKVRELFSQVGPSLLVNAAGSFIGSKLASEIKTFESVGGQIGSAVGAIYGSFAATGALASLAATTGVAASGASIVANA